MSFNPSRVFTLYGLFLIAGGLIAFAAAGFEARAKTAVLMGGGCGFVMLACAHFGKTNPTAIRVARGLAICFAAIFSFRAYKIIDVVEKQYLLYTFCVLVTGTIVALVLSSLPAKKASINKRKD